MEPRQMTPKEAQQIARHHLGERLHYVAIAADGAAVLVQHDDAPLQRFAAPTVDEAARDAAAQLRAAGWVPTHERLEWRSVGWQHHLCLVTGDLSVPLLFAVTFHGGCWSVLDKLHNNEEDRICSGVPREDAAAAVEKWHATYASHLFLPPFPETPDAT